MISPRGGSPFVSTRGLLLATSILSTLLFRATVVGQATCDPVLGASESVAFRVRAFNGTVKLNGGKCLDYGAEVSGSPVFLNDCSNAHPIRVRELSLTDSQGRPIRNHVQLLAGTKAIAVALSVVNSAGYTRPIAGSPLELQSVASSQTRPGGKGPNPLDQRFVLDGDSILVAANRNLAARVQNARGTNGTPIVVEARDLADSEFWDFRATDGSEKCPTSGFVEVASLPALSDLLSQPVSFGTVVKVDPGPIILSEDPEPSSVSGFFPTLYVPAGVTIRGERRGLVFGPQLAPNSGYERILLFEVGGAYTRITGLRLRGPTRSLDPGPPEEEPGLHAATGIQVSHDYPTLLDHLEMSDWPTASLAVIGSSRTHPCASRPSPPAKIDNVRVLRNFLHDNQRQGFGYGVVVGDDGEGTIVGNTFLRNRHAITAGGTGGDAYVAAFNLVLREGPLYDGNSTPDFDMHGYTGDPDDHHHFGGTGGNYVDIAWNTFFGGNRINYILRGLPCATNYFRYNVSMQDRGDAVSSHFDLRSFVSQPVFSPAPYIPNPNLLITNNQFNNSSPRYTDPTARLGVGDFDGDGRDDLFLATGTAFYFSPGGVAEWRLLKGGRTDRIENLLFGDFDGDGRTDVAGKNGRDVMVSWGGISDWEAINSTSAPISDLATGDFDGDGRSDLFWADGGTWHLSSGGSAPFVPVTTSGFRVKDLRFGDFDGLDGGKTDVFGVVSDAWQVSLGAVSAWQPLRAKLTDDVSSLVVADFNGDGRDDIGRPFLESAIPLLFKWRFSHGGVGDWIFVRNEAVGPHAGVGHFRGDPLADVLVWEPSPGNKLRAFFFGSTAVENYSVDSMR